MIRKDKLNQEHLEIITDSCTLIPSETFEKQLERDTLAVFSTVDEPDTQYSDKYICKRREDCGRIRQEGCTQDG